MDQQDRQVERQRGSEASDFALIRVALYKRMKAIAAFPILLAFCAVTVVLALPKRYEATATVQIDPRQRSKSTISDAPDLEPHQQTIEAEMSALQSAPVIRGAIDALHLDDDPEFKSYWPATWLSRLLGATPERNTEAALLKRLSVSRLRNTLLVSIRISSSDPVKSARIANAVADAYLKDWAAGKSSAETAATMLGQRLKDDIDGDGIITESERVFASLLAQFGQNSEVPGPSIVAAAVPPREATAAKPARTAGVAFALGLVAAVGLALLLEFKTSTRASRVEHAFACPHMTSLPTIPAHDATSARACRFVLAEPRGQYAEAVRETCRELEKRRSGAPSRLTLVVSALPGEGAECLASNIAHQYAVAGHSPLLVDADLRMGSLTRQLAGRSSSGLLDQIVNRKPVESAILRDCATGLHFLPACGPTPIPLPVRDILRSKAFADSMTALKRDFVTIVMSGPPLLTVGDAHTLAELADDIVFVTAWQKTPKRLARQALGKIAAHQPKIVGAALTDIADREDTAIMSLYEILEEMRTVAPVPAFRTHAA
ncbi:lipopolysaccharide biosynthesis protein [Hyphomicrobium denitrificans 1NES1]|uniref:Lipopolysaccharide biosynthesis protein n=1 Tax=Hyphomicrobium denitrificans 1NES1 TaxID=670307 RepID=N0B8V9_9HYPH|nr:tyrosine-protein kinase domain-containing protein [Hyphomicrobium denitrificans]AGK56475.1 lipopolysaccharide biosynthesis protein [Hyphomicrobium denitrificans 1NES1]